MVGVLLITHSNLGDVLIQNAQAIVGAQNQVRAVSQKPGMPFLALQQSVNAAIEELDKGRGVLMLVDIFGGTPCNVALASLSAKSRVVTGLNTAMLLKVFESNRESLSLDDLSRVAAEAARRSVAIHNQARPDCPAAPSTEQADGRDSGAREASTVVTVNNKLGLHASNSAKLVKAASRFESEITLSKGDFLINAKSIMGVLMLAASEGTRLTLSATGDDAKSAVEELGRMFEEKFGEE